jgi:hypothetical protein
MERKISLLTRYLFSVGNSAFADEGSGLLHFQNVQNWKVGDTLIYRVTNSYTPGRIQYAVRKVGAEVPEGFWLCGDLGYSITDTITTDCNYIQQFLVRKSDGVVVAQYTGVGGVDRGPYKNTWFIDSQKSERVTVPLGTFTAIHISARHYLQPPRPDMLPTEQWLESNLPLDGLVKVVRDYGSQVVTFELIKSIRGH